jgi:hypothetical protein
VGFVALASVIAAAQAVPQQPQMPTPVPPKGTGILLGQVVDAQDKRPIAGALVTLAGEMPVPQSAAPISEAPRQILTDGSGRFMFRSVAAGRYMVRATAGSYIGAGLGQNRPSGAPQSVELTTDDEKRDGLVVRMWKNASISGTVMDEAGEPVIGYSLRILRRTATSRGVRYATGNTVSTDDRGFYRVSGLVPGEYVVAMLSSQTTMPAATVDEYYREMMSGVSITTSQLYRELSSSGASPSTGGYRVGEFVVQANSIGRMGGPPPPSPADEGRMMTYLNQYYPSASVVSQATVLTLAAGEERANTDLRLKLVPAVRVSGTVTGPDGPVRNMGLRLLPLGIDDFSNSDSGMEIASSATDASGNFTMFGVPPGTYLLRATRIPRPAPVQSRNMTTVEVSGPNGMMMGMSSSSGPGPAVVLPTDPTLSGQLQLTVASSDMNGVSLALRTGPRISGRVVFEGTKPPPPPDQIQQTSISVSPISGAVAIQMLTAPKRVEPDGRFSTVGFPAGRYLISASAPFVSGQPAVWRMKSAMRAGRDVADEGLDLEAEDITDVVITFTDQTSDISGTVTDVKSQPDSTALVIAFPADNDSWRQGNPNVRRIRSARVTTTGAYMLALPPGAYYVAALSDEAADNWQDPVKLEAVMRGGAARVTLADGQKLTQALTTRPVR